MLKLLVDTSHSLAFRMSHNLSVSVYHPLGDLFLSISCLNINFPLSPLHPLLLHLSQTSMLSQHTKQNDYIKIFAFRAIHSLLFGDYVLQHSCWAVEGYCTGSPLHLPQMSIILAPFFRILLTAYLACLLKEIALKLGINYKI